MHNLIYLIVAVGVIWIISNFNGGKYSLQDDEQEAANQASLNEAHRRYTNLRPRK